MTMAGKEWSEKLLSQPCSHINKNPWIHDPRQCPGERLLLQLVIWPSSVLTSPKQQLSFPITSQRFQRRTPAWRSACRHCAAAGPMSGACKSTHVATSPCASGRTTLQQQAEAKACHNLLPALCAVLGLHVEFWDQILLSKPTKSSSNWSLKLYG